MERGGIVRDKIEARALGFNQGGKVLVAKGGAGQLENGSSRVTSRLTEFRGVLDPVGSQTQGCVLLISWSRDHYKRFLFF
jgi:hypothetical protein